MIISDWRTLFPLVEYSGLARAGEMGEFIVTRVANFWAVVHGEVMFVKRTAPLEAIAIAVETASRASRTGRARDEGAKGTGNFDGVGTEANAVKGIGVYDVTLNINLRTQ